MLFRAATNNSALSSRAPVVVLSPGTDAKLRHHIPFFTFGFRQPHGGRDILNEIISLDEPSTRRIGVDDLAWAHDMAHVSESLMLASLVLTLRPGFVAYCITSITGRCVFYAKPGIHLACTAKVCLTEFWQRRHLVWLACGLDQTGASAGQANSQSTFGARTQGRVLYNYIQFSGLWGPNTCLASP